MEKEPRRSKGKRLAQHLNRKGNRKYEDRVPRYLGSSNWDVGACLVHKDLMLIPLRSCLLLCIQLWPLLT